MGHFSWTKSFSRRSLLNWPTCFICIKHYVGLGFETNPFKIRGKHFIKYSLQKVLKPHFAMQTFETKIIILGGILCK
jgi:hypothetical protein